MAQIVHRSFFCRMTQPCTNSGLGCQRFCKSNDMVLLGNNAKQQRLSMTIILFVCMYTSAMYKAERAIVAMHAAAA